MRCEAGRVKRALLLPLALALLGGCQPQEGADGQTMPRPVAEAVAASHGPLAVVACWSNAVRGASNRCELEARFGAMADKIAVDYLASQSPGELARRLDTVTRGTSRSPYTAEQLHRARKAKGLE